MKKARPVLLLGAFLFATVGGCFGPLMAAHASTNCCTSMPCAPANQVESCCTTGSPGPASQFQQTAEVTAPAVAYAIVATLPHASAISDATRAAKVQHDVHCYSPPGELYTLHHSFLI